jgi:hypothetical protein
MDKRLVKAIEIFVATVYIATKNAIGEVKTDFSVFAETARKSLMYLFEQHSLELGAFGVGKGNKTVSANQKARFYVRANVPGIKASLVLKPRFKVSGKKIESLYGYFVTLDSSVTSTQSEIEAFLKTFDPDKLAKNAKVADVINSAAVRMINVDIGNDFAQTESKSALKAVNADVVMRAYISIPADIWAMQRAAVVLTAGEKMACLIDQARQEALEPDQDEESDQDEANA